ncbi:MAG: Gfo/Idh/MocA family protein [Chloroflexota bacterium]|jgi:predicted dehydrogenase
MDPIRYGVIGVGAVTLRAHLPVLAMMEDVEIVALCNPSRPKAEQGVELCRSSPDIYEDYRDLLARPDIDAVVIASPNHTHKEITLAALSAGKHVLCEKPMATNEGDCFAIQAAARKSSPILQYGMEFRYSDFYAKVAQIVQSGEIGHPRMMFCREFRWPMLPGSRGWRTDNRLSGGTLLEKNCHHFDLFNWFAGSRAVRVVAMGGSDVNTNEQIDNAWVVVEYANGVRGCLGLCLFSPYGNDLEVSVIGDRGKVESFAYNQVIHQWGADKPDKTVYNVAFDPLFGDIAQEPREKERSIIWERSMIYREHRAFIVSIRTGKQPVTNVTVAIQSCLVPLAAQRALKTGQVVTLAIPGSV